MNASHFLSYFGTFFCSTAHASAPTVDILRRRAAEAVRLSSLGNSQLPLLPGVWTCRPLTPRRQPPKLTRNFTRHHRRANVAAADGEAEAETRRACFERHLSSRAGGITV
jgi:hypothetical protein